MILSRRVRLNIARLLEAHGYTYGDLGWSYNYVCDVVHGRRRLSDARKDEFAARLKVDVSELCKAPTEAGDK